MASNRKLLAEIDKVLKKVQEGCVEFDDILEKVHSAATSNLKEKYEGDLKKEIKKLQRSRDQIKTWIASPEVKQSKDALQGARKLIETKMEQFKECEKNSKTKAFSKEGLSQAVDDHDEKADVQRWIAKTLKELRAQLDQFESELETIPTRKRDGNARVKQLAHFVSRHKHNTNMLEKVLRNLDNDTITPDQVEGIQETINYYVESNQEEDFMEDEEVYDSLGLVEEDESFVKRGSDDEDSSDESSEASDHPPPPKSAAKPIPAKPEPAHPPARTGVSAGTTPPLHPPPAAKPAVAPAAAVPGAGKGPAIAPAAPSKVPVPAAAAKDAKPATPTARPPPSPSKPAAAKEAEPHPPPKPAPPALPLQFAKVAAGAAASSAHAAHPPAAHPPGPAHPASAAAAAHAHPPSPALHPPAAAHGAAPSGPAAPSSAAASAAAGADHAHAAHPPARTPAVAAPPADKTPSAAHPASAPAAPTSAPQPPAAAASTPSPTPAASAQPPVPQPAPAAAPTPVASPALSQPPPQHQPPAPIAAAAPSTFSAADGAPAAPADKTKLLQAQFNQMTFSDSAFAEIAARAAERSREGAGGSGSGDLLGSQQLLLDDDGKAVADLNSMMFDSSLGLLHETGSLGDLGRLSLKDDIGSFHEQQDTSHASALAMLDASMRNIPEPLDSERPKTYTPRNPYNTPVHYPLLPAPMFESPALFEKFDTDTLFFVFYYQQGTYQQYLAAKELKKQSWRYHKKYLTWFQRHEEPKEITNDYEQGTYVYFDYETGWCQRKKTEFTFEYRYLEDYD